jgi:hypothetical protein
LLAFLLLWAFVVQGGLALRKMASTGDETHYLGMGGYLLKTHRWDLDDALLHPPLSYYLHSLPLLFQPLDYEVFKIPDANERGRRLLATEPADRYLILARIPVLLLATALGCLVWTWARQAYGPTAGLWALFLYCFSPTILSSAALITPDLCLAFFSTLTCYFLWQCLKRPSFAVVFMTGLALGLTLLSKYTGVLVLIGVVLIVISQVLHRHFSRDASGSWLGFKHLAIILLAAVLVLNAGYLFKDVFQRFDGTAFKSQLFRDLTSTGIFRYLPMPLPRAYILGMDWQYTVLENGFGYYLLGQLSKYGWVYYYLVAFLLKSPIPFLVLLAFAFVFHFRKGGDRLQLVLLLPVLVFFFYFSLTRVSRGIRYILPIYPLLFIWISQAADVGIDRIRVYLRWALPILVLWYAAGTLRVAPHYLAFCNELGGGPANGEKLFWEADFDWGQELKALGDFLRSRGIPHIRLGYFSTADPKNYGISYDPLPCSPVPLQPDGVPVAVSATALNWDCYRWLRQHTPQEKIGYTIFLYNLPREH